MFFSVKSIVTLAVLVNAAFVAASPIPDFIDDFDNSLERRYTQQECEAACTLAGFQGAAWTTCVQNCVAGNYPTPPPSPQNKAKKAPTKKGRSLVEEATLERRYTQQECEAACTLAGLQGAAWTTCVQNCVAGNYPTPPPSPQNKAKKAATKKGRSLAQEDATLERRYTQQECEAACTLAGFQGAAWTTCVQTCVAGNYPTPPPSPQNKAKKAPTKKGRNLVEEATLERRYTQQECEAACTLAGFQGAAWTTCVQTCVAGNYPTPPPSPQNKAKKAPTKKGRSLAQEDTTLERRYTQQECEAACTLAGFQGAAWTTCVQTCVAGNYPTPPPSPQNKAKKAPAKKGRSVEFEYEAY